jgi:hypothetical protein
MGQEFQYESFYDTKKYGMSYYSVQIALERFIAEKILRGDLSRILFTADSFVFRARMEQQDRSTAYQAASSLKFPFSNYWYEGFWERDDRIASNQASQQLSGINLGGDFYIRSRAVMTTIPFTFYFNSDNDARIAYEKLQWTFNPRSAVLSTTVKYKEHIIDIPVIVSLEDLVYNPDYTEKEWLSQNRIIPIRANFKIRTYTLGPNVQTPVPGGLDTTDTEDEIISITETALLQFFQSKNLYTTLTIDDIEPLDEVELAVNAYFDPTYDVVINSITSSNITYSSVKISWNLDIPPISDPTSIESIIISTKGKESVTINNPALIDDYVFTGLNELSTYKFQLYIKLKSGKIKIQTITITTANNPAVPDIGGLAGLKSLRGVTF